MLPRQNAHRIIHINIDLAGQCKQVFIHAIVSPKEKFALTFTYPRQGHLLLTLL